MAAAYGLQALVSPGAAECRPLPPAGPPARPAPAAPPPRPSLQLFWPLSQLRPCLLHAWMVAMLPPADADLSAHWRGVAADSLEMLSDGEVRALAVGLGWVHCSWRQLEEHQAPLAPGL